MAITDTYNGDLVRTRVYCPEEKSNFETEITQVQEDEFALMNIEIEKMGQAAAKDASYVNDALKIIGFDQDLMTALAGEMVFMQQLAHAGKIAQGRFIARKKI